MNKNAQTLIKWAVYNAYEEGFLPRNNIGIMDDRDCEMVMRVCPANNLRPSPSETKWFLVLFSSLRIPIHSGNLEKNRHWLTTHSAETMAELINWYVKFFGLPRNVDGVDVTPDNVLQEIKEIIENLRAYSYS